MRIVPKVLLKSSSIIYGIPLLTPLRDPVLTVEGGRFLQEFIFFPVHMACTQRGKEDVIKLLKQLDMHSAGHLPPWMSLVYFHF